MRTVRAIGGATNLAVRLQTFAGPGQVVIGEWTYALLGECADVRPLGTPSLKGKNEPVRVFELVGLCPPP